jgi:tetratricopeptide (TPR) repeat protein
MTVALLFWWARPETLRAARTLKPRLEFFQLWPDRKIVDKRAWVDRVNQTFPDMHALALMMQGQEIPLASIEEELNFFNDVVQVIPSTFDIFILKAMCEVRLGKKEDALSNLLVAHSFRPSEFRVLYNLGMYFFNLQKYDRAREYLAQALQADNELFLEELRYSPVYYRIFTSEGDKAGYISKSMRIDLFRALTISSLFLENFRSARDYALKGIELAGGKDADFYAWAGMADYQLKDFGTGVEHLRKALELDKDHAAAMFFLAQCYRKQGRQDMFDVMSAVLQKYEFNHRIYLGDKRFSLRLY